MRVIVAWFVDYITENAASAIFSNAISEIRNILNEKKTNEILRKRQQQLQRQLEEKTKEISEE